MTPTLHLTPRQHRLVRAIVRGRTNREIADELGMSEQTVKNQRSVVFQRFDVTEPGWSSPWRRCVAELSI